MFCTNCRKEIPDTCNFCKYCGNKITKNEEENQINQKEKTEITENTSTTPKTVKVTFHRLKKFTGCLVPMYVYVDKKLIATLKNNETYETNLTYGKHKIIIEMWSAVNEKEVEFSEDYTNVYIDLKLKMGFFTNKVDIANIRNEK